MARAKRLKDINLTPPNAQKIVNNAIILSQNVNWSSVGGVAEEMITDLSSILNYVYGENVSYVIPHPNEFLLNTLSVNLERVFDMNVVSCTADLRIVTPNKLYSNSQSNYFYEYLIKITSDSRKEFLF